MLAKLLLLSLRTLKALTSLLSGHTVLANAMHGQPLLQEEVLDMDGAALLLEQSQVWPVGHMNLYQS